MKLQSIFSISLVIICTSINVNANQTTTYTYGESGQVLTEDGPRKDVIDVLTYTYNVQGNLATVKNALGHVTSFTDYDARGNLLSTTNANGIETEFTYSVRDWLLTSRVKHPTDSRLDSITTFTYDPVGQLTNTELPNGASLGYEYDDARRLTAIKNNAGERVEFTLDTAGNHTKQVIKSSTGVIKFSIERTFDELSRVINVMGNNGQQINYRYDVNNNLVLVTDGRNNQLQQVFDAVNRVKQTIDADLGETNITYNRDDQIESITDAKGNKTIYAYDLFGNLKSRTSPDTGTTTFTRDDAGNITSVVDSRGVVANLSYDALNRLVAVSYPASPLENVNYAYDDTSSGNYGSGRLTSVYSDLQRTEFYYNYLGLVTRKYTTIGNSTVQIQYSYDSAGNLKEIVYPSGRIVIYDLDSQGRVKGISTKNSSSSLPKILVANAEYLPFGPASSFEYGNGLTHLQNYDQDYRLSSINIGGVLNRSYGYDPVNNITSIVNALNNSDNQVFTYDDLNHLISAAGSYGNLSYSYDKVGNRLSETRNGTTDNYDHDVHSNRLQLISRTADNRSFEYDNAGNQTQQTYNAGTKTYTYSQANRLTSVAINSSLVVTYKYNPLGQRVVKKHLNGDEEYYYYDETGHLIAVNDGSGKILREYIYWGDQQIAFATRKSVQYVSSQILDESNVSYQGSHLTAKNFSGYTGTGFVDYVGEGSANWVIQAPASTNYTLKVRYALVGSNRPLLLRVNGHDVSSLNFTGNSGWHTWRETFATISLPAGQNTISLHTTGFSGPNIDKIELASGSPIEDVSTELYYIHNDHQSTPQVITNENKQTVWMANYEPFGKIASVSAAGFDLFSRFPGQYMDPETGLYYNYFRDYDASIGRYIESDPIGLAGGINTYAYVRNNPINFVDPTGLDVQVTIWQPVGWGGSSFGHVSQSINGMTFSFGTKGTSVMWTSDYMARNSFRSGVTMNIKLTPEQDKTLINSLKNHDPRYNILTNNCTTPIQNALKELGIDLKSATLPVSLGNNFVDSGLVDWYSFQNATLAATGVSAPWAE